jgi:hypothetical protein
MKNAVLIIEDYPDESSVGLLVDYDNLPTNFKKLIDKGLATNKNIYVDAYEDGLQANMNSVVKIKPNEIIKFIGSVNFNHDY